MIVPKISKKVWLKAIQKGFIFRYPFLIERDFKNSSTAKYFTNLSIKKNCVEQRLSFFRAIYLHCSRKHIFQSKTLVSFKSSK